MNRISAFIREDTRQLVSSLFAHCHVMTQLEHGHLQTTKWDLTRTKSSNISILAFLDSVEINVCFISHSVYSNLS